ncbi:MAG TPA: hypothetical protein VIU11_21530, partial [Nakamurella sp.]
MTRQRLSVVSAFVALLVLLPVAPAIATTGSGHDRAAWTVVRDWERTSIRTIFPATPIPVGALYLGFTSLAMYRAAEATGHRGSAEAAVATAAHDVLVEYFPDSKTMLEADLTASLGKIRDGSAKRQGQGVQAGARAAAELIASRVNDGRNDSSRVYQRDPAPGVWQPPSPLPPTLPGGMLAPWLGFVNPVLLRQPIDPRGVDGPPALTSATYAAEVAEVQRVGSTNSTART